MATGTQLSLIDMARRTDPSGETADIAELLSMSDEIYEDLVMVEGNTNTGHMFTVRTSIPTGWWRYIGQGIPMMKTTAAQGTINCGMLTANSTIDRTLIEMAGSAADQRKARYQEDNGILEGMAQTVSGQMFYGNQPANPAAFSGFFAAYYNTVSAATSPVAANVFDGGGVGTANASIFLVGWSPQTIFGVFPKGMSAGLKVTPLDYTEVAYDSLGNPYPAYLTLFEQKVGLCVRDWRWASRLSNLDVTNAGLGGPGATDIFATLSKMVLRLPMMARSVSGVTQTDAKSEMGLVVRPAIYTNRTVRGYMDIQAIRNVNVFMRPEDPAGQPTQTYRGIPVRTVDKMTSTEARVV